MYHPDDILLWPNGSWCYRSDVQDIQDMSHLSDDYQVLRADSEQWHEFIQMGEEYAGQ